MDEAKIAQYLLDNDLLLTALELHQELSEAGLFVFLVPTASLTVKR